MKLLTIIGGVVVLAVLLVLIAASVYNFKSDRRPEAREFLRGHAPEPALDGSYSGNRSAGTGGEWLGKQFDARGNTGINNFRSKHTTASIEQRYPFTTALKPGLRNKDLTVLQLNYNVAGNPFWLRQIRDELVEVSPNQYLGKIQVKISFIVVTIGYFKLNTQSN